MADETDALITFEEGWQIAGTAGEDGLPLYETVVKIIKAKPPLLEVTSIATEADFEEFNDAYRRFEKLRQGRDLTVKGYPLALWPVITGADLKTLTARDIFTVEQLAQLQDRRDMPPPVRELAVRAKKLIAMQGKYGQYEAQITDLTARCEVLQEELKEAHAALSAQNALLNQLRVKGAA